MISSNIYQTKMRIDLGQWLCQSSFCLWARRGAAGAAFGRVWDPPLQKREQFRACRRGRTLSGPPGNGRQLGRAAQCAAPTKKRERSGISVGAGPRPARGRTLCTPTYFPKRRAGLGPAPTKKRERSGISAGAGPRPARGRTVYAPTVETVCPHNQGRSPHPSRLRRATFP